MEGYVYFVEYGDDAGAVLRKWEVQEDEVRAAVEEAMRVPAVRMLFEAAEESLEEIVLKAFRRHHIHWSVQEFLGGFIPLDDVFEEFKGRRVRVVIEALE